MAKDKFSIQQGVNSIEYSNPVDSMTFKVFNIFNVFRGQLDNYENTQIVLLLLSLYKDGIASYELINNNFTVDKLKESILRSNLIEKHKQVYISVIDLLSDSLLNVINHSNSYLSLHLFQIEKELLIEYFPAIYDDTIYRIELAQGRYAAEFIQPVELTRFMSRLFNLKPHSSVFNPFAGIASFGINLHEEQLYFGQEINQKTWVLGVLRLMAYGKLANSNFERADSIEEWPIDSKFDLIVSNPPFGMRVNNRFISPNPSVKSTDEFLIEKGIQSIKIGGKLIAVLSHGILFRGGSELALRKHLVNNDLIETIISFPGGVFQNTGNPFIVMIISNEKKLNNKVRFIKADNYVIEKSRQEKVLHDELLLNIYNSDIQFDNDIRVVDNEKIKSNDFNLNVPRYFLEDIIVEDNEKLIKLKDVVSSIKGRRVYVPEMGKFIRIRDLSDSKLDSYLDLSKVEVTEFNRPDVQKISESCLLLAMRWKTLKPTLFNFSGESIYISRDIMAFKINEAVIEHSYLVNELFSDYVQDQTDAFRIGITIPWLRLDDLLDIDIKLPSFKQSISDDLSNTSSLALQKLKVDGSKQAIVKSKEEALKLEKELLGVKDDAFREFASIKHTFRQYLSALKSNVAGTKKFIAKQHGKPVSFEDIYSKNLNETFGEHLENMDKTIDLLSSLLNTDKFESTTIEKLNFLDLVKEAQDCFKFDTFKYNEVLYDIVTSDGIETVPLEPIIEINKNDFFSLFSNIVSNAMNHGFKDLDKQYIIQSSISLYEDYEGYFVLDVSNNVRPIPDKFTLKHLTTRGEKTTDSNGAGIGGADIKDIVEKYNGKFELINDSKSTFPVTYRISFPILI